MKVLIFMGSPRVDGNTAELRKTFLEELKVIEIECLYLL